jgi:hypothetical protein
VDKMKNPSLKNYAINLLADAKKQINSNDYTQAKKSINAVIIELAKLDATIEINSVRNADDDDIFTPTERDENPATSKSNELSDIF